MDSTESLFSRLFSNKKLLGLAFFLMLLISLPVTIYLLQRQQETRQQAATESITLTPLADTYVQEAAPTVNNGSDQIISSDGSPVDIIYMKFDGVNFVGKTISSAKLRVYVVDGSSATQTLKDVSVTSWSESGMTFNNKPALGTTITTFAGGTTGSWKEIDITSYVSANIGKQFSFSITSTSSDGFEINTKEHATNKPQLLVTTTTSTTTSPSPVVSPVGENCPAVATDTVLVIDRSSSMKEELADAKTAAKLYVDNTASNSQNRLSLVVYDKSSSVTTALTNNFTSVKTAIDAITLGGGTCTQCGVDKANGEITAHGRSGIKKVVVLLTDGRANMVNGQSVSNSVAEDAAITSVTSGRQASSTTFFSIGLGSTVNSAFLQEVATIGGGKYYFSPTANDLANIYKDISGLVGKGSITGVVFNDANGNAVKDSSETGLSGWNVKLTDSSNNVLANATSSSTGSYEFTALCDKSYVVDATPQSGWSQTTPTNDGNHTVNISNGSSNVNKDFGFKQTPPTLTPTNVPPTPTKVPTPTTIASPTVNLTVNKPTVLVGESVILTWTSTNATTCSASGTPMASWSGTKQTTGNQSVGPLTVPENYIFTITCTNSTGSADDTVTVTAIMPTPSVTKTPTATTAPQETAFDITLFLHGLGNSGDNANPASSLSNKNPIRKERNIFVEVFDSNNELLAAKAGSVIYASGSGNFKGSVNFGTQITTGNYTIKIKSDQYLRNSYAGIQTLQAGNVITLPPLSMVTGDSNNDNKLNILDYNILYGCYSTDLFPVARSCDDDKKVRADLTDEGNVNHYDLNLFIRELSVQSGV